VPEYETDDNLYFDGQKATPNIIKFNEILHEFNFANNKQFLWFSIMGCVDIKLILFFISYRFIYTK
jgi:hypothetical protein